MLHYYGLRAFTVAILFGVGGAVLAQQSPKPCSTEWARDLVERQYLHGFPQGDALAAGCAVTDQLSQELSRIRHDKNGAAFYQNAILLEGILGNVRAWDSMRSYLDSANVELYEDGKMTVELYRSKLAVLKAAGMLLNRTVEGSPAFKEIYGYLRNGARPGAWSKISWHSPYDGADDDDRNLALSEASIRALGISGQRVAAQYLTDLDVALRQVKFSPEGDLHHLPPFLVGEMWKSADLTPPVRDVLQKAALESIEVAQAVRGTSLQEQFSAR